jgi:divalent anion:Na+ symporter, DASS family
MSQPIPWSRWAVVLIPGTALYFSPVPGLNPQQRHLLAVFLATIISLVAQPVAMGLSVLTGLVVLALTQTVPATKVLTGFSSQTTWLILAAFLFAKAISHTGLGMRVAYFFIGRFGRSPLSLAYSIAAANSVLAPFVPSDTARGGAIIYPITRSLTRALGSEPGPQGATGAFLMLSAFHTNYVASGLFLTSMAANPLIADYAARIAHVEISWTRWALATLLPGVLSMVLVPWILSRWSPPAPGEAAAAREFAASQLAALGPVTAAERSLLLILAAVMAGWVFSPLHGVPNTFVAIAGLAAILIARVIDWQVMLAERAAWDVFLWFGPLLMMSDQLAETGVVGVLSAAAFSTLHGWPWQASLAALSLLYLYLHYAFASMTAHAIAFYPPFLTAAIAAGVPPYLAVFSLAAFSNMDAGLTHYGTGSAPIFFNDRYVSLPIWWRHGFGLSLVHIVLWLGLGSLWWSLLF